VERRRIIAQMKEALGAPVSPGGVPSALPTGGSAPMYYSSAGAGMYGPPVNPYATAAAAGFLLPPSAAEAVVPAEAPISPRERALEERLVAAEVHRHCGLLLATLP
jgi:hypothetical protein